MPVRLLNEIPPCDELGVTKGVLLAIRVAPPGKGQMMLDELKRVAKSQYRKLAFALHPDRNPGDSASAAKFSHFSAVFRQIEKMECQEYAPAPPLRPVGFREVIFQFVPVAGFPRPGAHPPGIPFGIPFGMRVRPSNQAPSPAPGTPRGARVANLRPT